MKAICLLPMIACLFAPLALAIEPDLAETEFTSLEDARAVQNQLRAVADKVAPAVVQLSTGGGDYQGSGVVIDRSGLILTHGHHDLPRETVLKATFPDGRAFDAVIESVYSGTAFDFSLLKIQTLGDYPAVQWRRNRPPDVGERCFHFGYPGALNEVTPLSTPLLRLGRIAGTGLASTYANCLTVSGDSGGPLFDLEGRLIGVLDLSIGPELRHPGKWADIARILNGATFLTPSVRDEVVKLGFLDRKRNTLDTRRHITNRLFTDLLAPARHATVEVLVDGQPTILGTIVDANGLVITKRSEIMTHHGILFGKLTCRMFDGQELSATAAADSLEDDVAVLQLPQGKWTPAPFSSQTEPRRGVIVMVPIPGKELSETGVVGMDRPLKIAPRQGNVPWKVEMRKAGVTVTATTHNLEPDDLAKLIRGSIREGDVITEVDGQSTPDLAAYESQANRDTLMSGDFVQLTVLRDRATSQAIVPLSSYHRITSNSYADPSLRLTGFPAVLIHDTIVGRRQCGGPVVDLEGRVIGVNIARFHRCSTFAIAPQRTLYLIKKLSIDAQTKDK